MLYYHGEVKNQTQKMRLSDVNFPEKKSKNDRQFLEKGMKVVKEMMEEIMIEI
jgi:hypothetical protein